MAIPFTITVSESHPSNTIGEFVEWAKARAGKVNFGVCAAQSVPRLVGEQFMRSAGLDFNSIPNSAGCMGDNMTGLMNGSLDVAVGVVPATTRFKGQVKHLGLIADDRHAMALELATVKEQGVDVGWGNATLGWGGLAVPAGTPDDVTKKLQDTIGKIVKSEEFLTKLGPLANMINYVPPAEFEELWASSIVLLGPYVEAIKSGN